MTIDELTKLGIKKLTKTSDSPALDSEVLLSHALNKPKEYLLTNPSKEVALTIEKRFLKLLRQRRQGWPVAYLTGEKEFYGLKFYVDRNVLIPRPETEGLVDLILSQIADNRSLSILDLGTGSGCIVIVLANSHEYAHAKFFASDISPKAMALAKKNAKRHKVKITFRHGSLLNPWKSQTFDIIVANLPYLTRRSDPSTKFEPTGALIAAKKGLALYEELFRQITAKESLTRHRRVSPSTLFLEIGHDQARAMKKLAKKFLPAYKTKVFKDLFGRTRYAVLTKKLS